MKILVFIKQIPGTDEVRLDEKTGNLLRDGVESVINPIDKNAIEAALELRDANGGTVTAITMGPPQAAAVLNRALYMGCDDVRLLSDRSFGGADTLATGYVLAKAAEKFGDYDLLVFGQYSADADTAQTGPIVAEFLGIPHVSLVNSISVKGDWLYCYRALSGAVERVRVKLPALITVTREANTPRFQTPGNVLRGLKVEKTVWNSESLNCDEAQIGVAGSPSKTKRVFAPPARAADTQYFSGDAEDVAAAFVELLKNEHLV